ALTEAGVALMEKRLGIENLYDPTHIELLHHVNQGLRAHVLFKRDVDYVVKDGEVMIVDEFTGRLMPGRRWSDGLHQAIEAKENVTIENENQTLATITFQNYFRMYKKLSGMTGTADTEATEFKQIYKLDVTVIPTNRAMVRKDQPDMVYKSLNGKLKAIATEIKRIHEKGQPVLVGTVSVEKSELLAHLLKKEGIKHHVLNAKQHEREADIVAQAGRKGWVTIATNMAGRGTDILLGGNPEVLAKSELGALKNDATPDEKSEYEKMHTELAQKWQDKCAAERLEVIAAGGLFILGTERHESRRIDNQLRGRAGRQGDPGESRFYLSLDDDLMRIFGGVNIARFMEEDMPIEHNLITKAIANAQRKVEAHNYDIRKHLLEYDDVMNQQRKVVYAWRKEVLSRDHLRQMVFSMVDELAGAISEDFFPGGKLKKSGGQALLDKKELNDALRTTFSFSANVEEKDIHPFNGDGLRNLINKLCGDFYAAKEKQLTEDTMRQLEKMILLTTIDQLWKDHLLAMDHLREGIGLQGYGQKDPLIEYKKQGYKYFEMMMNQITGDVARKLFAVQLAPADVYDEEAYEGLPSNIQYNVSEDGSLLPQKEPKREAPAPAFDMNKIVRRPQQMSMGRGPMGSPLTATPGGPAGGPLSMGSMSPSNPAGPKVGRNDPCPCGSGKKYKKCHGT
ncbi:MAG: SEC-C metal-binding domain-containing protein, partial [Bdellovibrionota bacterium]